MIRTAWFVSVCALAPGGAAAQALKDVPASHWARPAVMEMVQQRVMEAPNGKFNGGAPVTRAQLAQILASYARSLDRGDWTVTGARKVTAPAGGSAAGKQPVTRYELAAVLSRAARYVAAGLPKRPPRPYPLSDILPRNVKVTVPTSHPAYQAVKYLVDNRMAWGPSVVLKPDGSLVTGTDLVVALRCLIVGLNNLRTDEPQNREEIPRPPSPAGGPKAAPARQAP